MERIAKKLARAGVASRRAVEKMIADRRIMINGEVVTSPAVKIDDSAGLTIDGQAVNIKPPSTRLWRYHKPKGMLVTTDDPRGRPTIFSALPPTMPRVITVGRLDYNTEGLLLLTNDGELKRRLELPANGWLRCYRVRAYGYVEAQRLSALEAGVTINGICYSPVTITDISASGANVWFSISLREGKYREIRHLAEFVGLRVNRLIRIAYGPFNLDNLVKGQVAEVPGNELRQIQR